MGDLQELGTGLAGTGPRPSAAGGGPSRPPEEAAGRLSRLRERQSEIRAAAAPVGPQAVSDERPCVPLSSAGPRPSSGAAGFVSQEAVFPGSLVL